ncbi:hypothetical protein DFH09DRAFT_1315540 [Mycena vulgaris]|nr:hypothetical protein DFH09DRAFT_1315540 [Mycena vulgaris]
MGYYETHSSLASSTPWTPPETPAETPTATPTWTPEASASCSPAPFRMFPACARQPQRQWQAYPPPKYGLDREEAEAAADVSPVRRREPRLAGLYEPRSREHLPEALMCPLLVLFPVIDHHSKDCTTLRARRRCGSTEHLVAVYSQPRTDWLVCHTEGEGTYVLLSVPSAENFVEGCFESRSVYAGLRASPRHD